MSLIRGCNLTFFDVPSVVFVNQQFTVSLSYTDEDNKFILGYFVLLHHAKCNCNVGKAAQLICRFSMRMGRL